MYAACVPLRANPASTSIPGIHSVGPSSPGVKLPPNDTTWAVKRWVVTNRLDSYGCISASSSAGRGAHSCSGTGSRQGPGSVTSSGAPPLPPSPAAPPAASPPLPAEPPAAAVPSGDAALAPHARLASENQPHTGNEGLNRVTARRGWPRNDAI